MRKTVLLAALGLMLSFTPAYALIPNGDFETGDLTGYHSEEDFAPVPSSALVKNVDDGTGNHVGQITTGFTSDGVTTATLAADLGTLPVDVQDLFFDVKFFDVGEDKTDNPPIFALKTSPNFIALESLDSDLDTLSVSFGNFGTGLPNFFNLTSSGYTADPGIEVEALSSGFYRVKTNVSGFAGTNNNGLYFDLYDGDDLRLSKVHVDNIDLTTANQAVAPEPASMFLIGSGLLGFGFLRKKKLV